MVGFVELPVDYVWQTGQDTVGRENLLRHASEKEGGYVEFFVQKNYDGCLDFSLPKGRSRGDLWILSMRVSSSRLAVHVVSITSGPSTMSFHFLYIYIYI